MSSVVIPVKKRGLALVPGSNPRPMGVVLWIHFAWLFIPRLFVTIPISLFWNYVLARGRPDGVVAAIGRSWHSEIMIQLSANILGRMVVSQSRLIANRTQSYDNVHALPAFKGFRDWVELVHLDSGVSGRWLAPPGTQRSDDAIVFFYIHGGGFTIDSSGNAQVFLLELAKEMNLKRKVQFSVFCLDYELAPEFKYPSQLIETLAAYHHLVNTLHIPAERICIGGDSAGGNLAVAFLLHLARPNPAISVPAEFGPTPRRPGSALLISPFTKLVSHLPSRTANMRYDLLDDGGVFSCALEYIGAPRPDGKRFVPSFNPLNLVWFPNPSPPRGLVKSAKGFTAAMEGEGLDLLSSPYVNPSVCEDLEWWKAAIPGDGRTMVAWGGREIFSDDIVEFVDTLNEADVAPVTLCKPLGVHDFLIIDSFLPGIQKTRSTGPDRDPKWGVQSVAAFFQSALAKALEATSSATRAEGAVADVGGSVVLVDLPAPGKS